jgi:YfiH family protein
MNSVTLSTPGTPWSAKLIWSDMTEGPMNQIKTVDSAADLKRGYNLAKFIRAIDAKVWRVVFPHLEHGTAIKFVNYHNAALGHLECDGLITAVPDVVLTVNFADCPSVVLFSAKDGVLCLLHAGWRGVSDGIVERAIELLGHYDVHPTSLQAYVGPSARRCCYEVGADVARKVSGLEYEGVSDEGKVMLHLPNIIGARLIARGVLIDQVTQQGDCTICTRNNLNLLAYYSWRRMGGPGEVLKTNIFTATLKQNS